jgi:hypothetical protein
MELSSTVGHDPARDSPHRGGAGGWAFPLGVAAMLAAWTLLAWGSWLLVGLGSQWLDAASGWLVVSPEALYWSRAAVQLLESSGAVLIVILWLMGAVGIVAGAWITRRLWRGAQRVLATAAPAGAADTRAAALPALPDGRRPADG